MSLNKKRAELLRIIFGLHHPIGSLFDLFEVIKQLLVYPILTKKHDHIINEVIENRKIKHH